MSILNVAGNTGEKRGDVFLSLSIIEDHVIIHSKSRGVNLHGPRDSITIHLLMIRMRNES